MLINTIQQFEEPAARPSVFSGAGLVLLLVALLPQGLLQELLQLRRFHRSPASVQPFEALTLLPQIPNEPGWKLALTPDP